MNKLQSKHKRPEIEPFSFFLKLVSFHQQQVESCWFLNHAKETERVQAEGTTKQAKHKLSTAQCVELALRWQFCVHSSICHEIYF